MTEARFRELVGGIIHLCGMLEFMTNRVIKQLGRDSLLSNEIITLSFGRRIKILRDLLRERSPWPPETVDSLCDELSKIAEFRNKVAHNPIATDIDNEDAGPFIAIVRHKFDPFELDKITEAELQLLAKQVQETVQRWLKLSAAPQSSTT
jgi:hypothetical protein